MPRLPRAAIVGRGRWRAGAGALSSGGVTQTTMTGGRLAGGVMAAVARLGRGAEIGLGRFGEFSLFAGQTLRWSARSAVRPRSWRLLLPQFYEVGVKSVPVVGVVGAFIGMVLAVESYAQFKSIGQENRLGAVLALMVVKQIGPLMASVMLAGRVGGALTAELGTMNVTEQLDALRVMGSDPVGYLVVPRFLACLLLTPLLTIFSDVLGIAGGWFVNVVTFHISNEAYWQYSEQGVEHWQILEGLLSSLFFGGAIGLIGCYKGFTCGSGASGVGRACTESFVQSFIAIIVLNFILAKVGHDAYVALYGNVSVFG